MQNFINLSQTADELLVFMQKSKMAPAAILGFIFVQYYSQFIRKTIKSVYLPNLVQIYAITSELCSINWIRDGGGRHLEFITIATFGHMAYFL